MPVPTHTQAPSTSKARVRVDLPEARKSYDFKVPAAVVIVPCPKEMNSSGYASLAYGRRSDLVEIWVRFTKQMIDAGLESHMVHRLAKERNR